MPSFNTLTTLSYSQDQWSKPTKPKGHWQKNRLQPWMGRHGYQSRNGWRGNSANTILLDQIKGDNSQ